MVYQNLHHVSYSLLYYSLAKLQRKIYNANVALEYFILNNWDFKNRNFIRLASEIKPEDK